MTRRILLLLIPFVGLSFVPRLPGERASDPDSAPVAPNGDYDLRFFCPARPPTPRYTKDRAGRSLYVVPAFDEVPPSLLYLKKGAKEYLEIQLSPNAFGEEIRFPAKSMPGALELFAAKLDRVAAPAAPEGKPMGPVAKVTKVPFTRLELKPGTPALVCFYCPTLEGKWFPPNRLSVDLSFKKYPAESCLILNLTTRPLVVAFGVGAPLTEIPPEQSRVLPPGKLSQDGTYPVRIASRHNAGYSVLLNASQSIAAGQRAVVVITPTDPATNAGLSESAEWRLFPESKENRKNDPSPASVK